MSRHAQVKQAWLLWQRRLLNAAVPPVGATNSLPNEPPVPSAPIPETAAESGALLGLPPGICEGAEGLEGLPPELLSAMLQGEEDNDLDETREDDSDQDHDD